MLARITGDSALCDVNLTQQRHADAVRDAYDALAAAAGGWIRGCPWTSSSSTFRRCARLGQITGETADDALITRIFSAFCLGK
jgi:tRNA U34 5-carboxymethylaminomethyl modifying GTPase MnmE/TrmE